MLKKCSTCKNLKTYLEFGKNKYNKNGIQSVCRICKKQFNQRWLQKNPGYMKQYQEKNIDKIVKRKKKWLQKNSTHMLQYFKQYRSERRKNNSLYKFKDNIRTLIRNSFKRNSERFHKNSNTVTLLGCTIAELRDHLEKQFQVGMTWENHGRHGWHVDHRMPLASAKTQEEIEKLCHYTTLQPLWAKDNLSKGSKYVKN